MAVVVVVVVMATAMASVSGDDGEARGSRLQCWGRRRAELGEDGPEGNESARSRRWVAQRQQQVATSSACDGWGLGGGEGGGGGVEVR